MVQASEPLENRTQSTIRKSDMSGFRIPTVLLHVLILAHYTLCIILTRFALVMSWTWKLDT